jgi:AcrR family transcriptional regulator
MQEVASAAGIGGATVYRWLANRDDLTEGLKAQALADRYGRRGGTRSRPAARSMRRAAPKPRP